MLPLGAIDDRRERTERRRDEEKMPSYRPIDGTVFLATAPQQTACVRCVSIVVRTCLSDVLLHWNNGTLLVIVFLVLLHYLGYV